MARLRPASRRGARMDGEERGARERDELLTVVARLRTNLATRGRSGLLGVPKGPSPRKSTAASEVPAPPAVPVAVAPAPRAAPEPSFMKASEQQDDDLGLGPPRGAAGLTL